MNKEDALRDLYDHERDVRLMILLVFVILSAAYITAAIGFAADSSWAAFASLAMMLIASLVLTKQIATIKDGYIRQFYAKATSGMSGVPLETKREALAEYRITEESDLEDIE